jgi:hypothetical protein
MTMIFGQILSLAILGYSLYGMFSTHRFAYVLLMLVSVLFGVLLSGVRIPREQTHTKMPQQPKQNHIGTDGTCNYCPGGLCNLCRAQM